MSFPNAFGGGLVGKVTANAGTAFYALIPGLAKAFTRLVSFSYTAAGTAHVLTVLRPIGRAKLAAAGVANTDTVTLDGNPFPSGNTIASGDQVVIQQDDGTQTRHTVSSWNGTTKVLTLGANLTANIKAGARLWNFGVFGDTDPVTGTAHPGIPAPANATTVREFVAAGVRGAEKGDPLLLHSANGTNAGTLDYAEWVYSVK